MLENPEGCYFKLKKHSLVICLCKVGILQAPSLCLLFDSNSQKDRCMISKHMGSNAGWIKHTRFLVSQDISSDLFLTIKVQRTGRFQPISTDFNRFQPVEVDLKFSRNQSMQRPRPSQVRSSDTVAPSFGKVQIFGVFRCTFAEKYHDSSKGYNSSQSKQ